MASADEIDGTSGARWFRSHGRRPRLGHLVRVTAALALACGGVALAPLAVSPAIAAPGDGIVTVRVVQEVNANGLVDSTITEPPLIDVTVTLTDSEGNTQSATTNEDGLAVIDPSTGPLIGGRYRVDVDNPRPDVFHPGFAANGQSGPAAPVTAADLQSPANAKLSTDTEFIDVTDGQNAYVNTSFWYPPYYCQENAAVCDAVQPWDAAPGAISPATEKTLISTPYRLNQNDIALATKADTGVVYGIAYDRERQRIFSAAYAKRASAYGPAGPGGLYVTDLTSTTYPLTGTTSQFATVPNAGADNHDMDTNQDYGFYDHAGKESLGDIDITNDNRYLFGVNMFDKTVFVYDLADDSSIGSYPIPNPGCGADWRPMGTGVGLGTSYVGGVCSGQTDQDMSQLTAHVYEFDPATGAFGAQVLDQSLTYGRGIARTDAWCNGTLNRTPEGRWFSWIDAFPAGPNEQSPSGCDNANGLGNVGNATYPMPMLGDIVEETNGDLVISFRDRFGDQVGYGSMNPRATGVFTTTVDPATGGDLVRGCKLTDGDFVLDPNYAGEALAAGSVCTDNNGAGAPNGGQVRTFREYYTGEYRTGFHHEALYGGIALSRVEPNLVGSGIDPEEGLWTQGILAVNRDGGRPTGALGEQTDDGTVDRFGKGGGMADLEVLCDEAPLQIGNRVWLDSDRDGVQDAGEPGIGGVTVHLYDGDGTLVGTTTTSPNGTYLFDDSNVTGGLQPGTDYTIAVDNPDDYAPGGPLEDLLPTTPNAGSEDSHDSDGVVPDGGLYPQVSLTTGGPGEDNPTYDFGYIEHAPAVGIEKYDTTDGAVAGDADTAADALAYQPGESRTVAFDVTNTGTTQLRDVVVTDTTITGGTVTAMSCVFPGHSAPTAGAPAAGVWTVTWAQTQGASPEETWAPTVVFTCTATLTLAGDAAPHADTAAVTATDVDTGAEVSDSDGYHAFTGDIQLVKYDGRGDFVPAQDGDGIPQKPLVDGSERDANNGGTAVTYVVTPSGTTTGPHPVDWAVTNTGTTWLGEIEIIDDTLDGPDLANISCDFSSVGGPATGTSWDGPWEPGTTFYCTGELTLDATGEDSTHADRANVSSTVIAPAPNPDYDPSLPPGAGNDPFTDQPASDGNGDPVLTDVHPGDDDPYYANTAVPAVELTKGDGNSATRVIVNDANTMDDGQAYAAGETRDIVLNLTNNGDTDLYDVTVTDELTVGDTTVEGLSCLFPGQVAPTVGTLDGTTWTVYWTETFEGAAPVAWTPGVSFSCTATLTLEGSAAPHADTATVTTNMTPVGVPGDAGNPPPATPDGPTDQDAYNAFTGDIQVIKYDGNQADPAIGSGPNSWTVPVKPLTDAGQDANTWQNAVDYPAGEEQPVRWVVTNTGATWLTEVTLTDATGTGPDVGAWTCDLSDLGGPAAYSFTTTGPWAGPLAPGASFFCEGPLTLPTNARHADTVEVTGTVVQPLFDDDNQPVLDGDGVPEYATDGDDNPVPSDVTVGDDDPFHAQTTEIDIVKGDGHGDTVVNDADTTTTGAVYSPAGETRSIVSVATNPSLTPLHDVTITDVTTAGTAPRDMSCTFPDNTSAGGSYDAATKTWTVRWAATFAPGTTTWQPGGKITCTSKLTLDGQSAPHRDVAQVAALTPAGTQVGDDNPYNAFSGDIQVIKYDGNKPDPAVGTDGAWTPPAKPLTGLRQDANDMGHAAGYPLNVGGTSTGPQKVRWVVTNTGTTWLTSVVITDVTDFGPAIKTATIRCTFPDGTTAGVVNGSVAWRNPDGVLFAPGASFFCQGKLTLAPDQDHADHVDVTATIVPPAADQDGNPTDQPTLGPDGLPVQATNPVTGRPWTVADTDGFHATSPAAEALSEGLPDTGTSVSRAMLAAAGLLLATGLLLLLIARRRSRRHS